MVEEVRGKANLTKYRRASREVMKVICEFSDLIVVERASIDEAYLDLTKYVESLSVKPSLGDLEGTFIAGLPDDKFPGQDKFESQQKKLKYFYDECEPRSDDENLLIASVAINNIRAAILAKTQFKCSAGISHNKILAKLAGSMNKPNAQTILSFAHVPCVFETTPIDKVRNLGGKLGDLIKEKYQITTMGQLASVPETILGQDFDEKTYKWLLNVRRGVDNEQLEARQIPKSIGCGKNFPGVRKMALESSEQVIHWYKELCGELVERIEEDQEMNQRIPTLMTIHMKFNSLPDTHKSLPLHHINCDKIVHSIARYILPKYLKDDGKLKDPAIMLSIAASKFIPFDKCAKNSKLERFFHKVDQSSLSITTNSTTNDTTNNSSTSESRVTINETQQSSDVKMKIISPNKERSSENQPKRPRIARILLTSESPDTSTNYSSSSSSVPPNPLIASESMPKRRGFFHRKTLELAQQLTFKKLTELPE
ncbi:DNA polymerase eta-like isoform X2 [Brevipalpus obovatus]